MEIEYTQILVSGVIGIGLGFFLGYSREKGKNKALKEDISELTDAKEKIVAEYKLEHEKRKHQYEKKHEVYSRYHNLLDKFHANQNPLLDTTKIHAMWFKTLNEIAQNSNDEAKGIERLNKFKEEIGFLVRSSFDGIQEIANQSNELKLVAPNSIISKVESIDNNYKQIEHITTPFFQGPIDNEKLANGTTLDPMNQRIDELFKSTVKLKTDLIKLMKDDLNKI